MFKLRSGYELFSDSQAFLLEEIGIKTSDFISPRRIVTALTVEEVKIGGFVEPSFRLESREVQELFDDLWKQGFRPKDGTGNGGHVEAIKYHLEDMRRLVFSASAGGL